MNKNILIGAVIFLCGGAVGVVATSVRIQQAGQLVTGVTNPDYQSGFEAARKLFQESTLGKLPTSDDARDFFGTVTAIDGNRITITDESVPDPFEKSAVRTRVAVTNETTKFFLLRLRDRCVSVETGLSMAKASLSDVQVGDAVTVISEAKIAGLSEFSVQEVQVVRKQ